jgi:copper homeostasis protein
MKPILEVAIFNIQSAITAANAGADRLEVCENPFDGGTTPSFGFLKKIREKVNIPMFPIIRPHGGDFQYTLEEFEVMIEEILLCKSLGFEGVVVGILSNDGSIDEKRTAALVALAYPMKVTFHRAFDRCKDPIASMETIIECGCHRILTSGQYPNVMDGKKLVRELVAKADNRIIILPGSGVRSNNIKELIEYTGAKEAHSSARKVVRSSMKYVVASMQEELVNMNVDTEEIAKMQKALEQVHH